MDNAVDSTGSLQVTLAQLPYTGFDYGDVYNNLFWVALAVWSFVIAWFIISFLRSHVIKKTARQAASTQGQEGMVYGSYQDDDPAVILSERVVQDGPVPAKLVSAQVPQVSAYTLPPTVDKEVVDRVQSIVNSELGVSRQGAGSAEASETDFDSVDFDGVNPDDAWQPREIPADHVPQRTQEPAVRHTEPLIAAVKQEDPLVVDEVPVATPVVQKVQKILYKDSIALDNTGEFPKVVLTREEA